MEGFFGEGLVGCLAAWLGLEVEALIRWVGEGWKWYDMWACGPRKAFMLWRMRM
jgi:hypothetical protein